MGKPISCLVYKGKTIIDAFSSCGFPFEVGKSYLLFSSGRRNESRVDICDGSINIELATERIKDLQQIVKAPKE